jgi:preprotein translocase subunit SecG
METWITVMIVLHVLLALAIIGLVLLQHGKGADMGSGFGGGASGSLFGATGSANFLSRATAILATIFFVMSLGLAYFATNKPTRSEGVLDAIKNVPSAPPKPAAQPPAAEPPKPAAPADGPKAKDVPR